MKTQVELLYDELIDLGQIKAMVARIDNYVVELLNSSDGHVHEVRNKFGEFYPMVAKNDSEYKKYIFADCLVDLHRTLAIQKSSFLRANIRYFDGRR